MAYVPRRFPDPVNAVTADSLAAVRAHRDRTGASAPRQAPRLVLLDLDGTLMDSAPGIIASIRYAFESLGHPLPTDEELRAFVGPPIAVSLLAYGVPRGRVDEGIRAYREAFSNGGMFVNAVFPRIPDMLVALRDSLIAVEGPVPGPRLVVATSKPETYARIITERFALTPLLDAVYGASMDGSRISKADVIAHALAEEAATTGAAVAPDRIVMVGDREHDVLGAAAHGIATVGVSWGYGSRDELLSAGAVAIADSPSELVPLLSTPGGAPHP